MKKWLLLPVLFLILAGCNNENSDEKKSKSEESNVGFEMSGDNIEEVKDIPEKEKEKIIAAFQEYIDSFNAEDINRYKKTLSENAEGFNYEEDVQAAQDAFKKYDINKKSSDITIVKYSDKEAQVFSKIVTDMTETSSKAQLSYSGRQVTVFVKEDDDWKISSIFYIGDQPSEEQTTK